ncbi:fungal-specific transcription factor domain-containing protein [Lineolata rhizophorae]|uniref:Fungal-specific transcription factor domain-containing protein n=1 Tax=Lineolata rhizophorae TaxID=578093 RepID=A0A6A6NVY2_9PEZI|nr:fungal-specific transcription factor domain-containing protein [Lineolata rhizophorae]
MPGQVPTDGSSDGSPARDRTDFGEFQSGSRKRRVFSSERRTPRVSRFLGQQERAGEGTCYVYDDGSYCRTVIDGEAVNPAWGITKAGKPRKRLAQACLTCREKKIKCDPGSPKCAQCQKSHRICRGTGSVASSGGPVGVPSAKESDMTSSGPASSLRGSSEGRGAPWESPVESGARRTECKQETVTTDKGSFREPSMPANLPYGRRDYGADSIPDSRSMRLSLAWEKDPFEHDRGLTLQLLDLYFIHLNSATYCMFPQKQFRAWVQNGQKKSLDDHMVLYTLMAMASVFSRRAEVVQIGERLCEIAEYAIAQRFGVFSLQLLQSRLILGFYHFARGRHPKSWDYCGTALRTVSALRLNTEEGVKDLPADPSTYDYGFDRPTLEECRRRTFWASFLMDRYNGFCGGTLCMLHPEDTFVRLPCSTEAYEEGLIPETPLFMGGTMEDKPYDNSKLSPMAHLALISVIWGDVLTHTRRFLCRPPGLYEKTYEAFYSEVNIRMRDWEAHLPLHLRWSRDCLDRAIREGYGSTFISIHALYHATAIHLNRYASCHLLSRSSVIRNFLAARSHAQTYTDYAILLTRANCEARLGTADPNVSSFAISAPFPGYALLVACDVLAARPHCAAGRYRGDILGAVHSSSFPSKAADAALRVLEAPREFIAELAQSWASASAQRKALAGRHAALQEWAQLETYLHSKVGEPEVTQLLLRGEKLPVLQALETPLESLYEVKDDLVYACDPAIFTARGP